MFSIFVKIIASSAYSELWISLCRDRKFIYFFKRYHKQNYRKRGTLWDSVVQNVGVRCNIVYSNPERAIGHKGFNKVVKPWTNVPAPETRNPGDRILTDTDFFPVNTLLKSLCRKSIWTRIGQTLRQC